MAPKRYKEGKYSAGLVAANKAKELNKLQNNRANTATEDGLAGLIGTIIIIVNYLIYSYNYNYNNKSEKF